MKKLDFDLKFKLYGKRIYPAKSVKYLGIKIDENITWIDHINDTAIKLNRANAMLYKVREFVNIKIPRSIYYAIFHCHLCKHSLGSIQILHESANHTAKKAFRIMSFECRNAHSNPLFFRHEMIKLPDKIVMENCLSVIY